ncbi:MAG: anaerobic sulfatase maturase [Thermodesulfobacteriota bacterium]|nr:anaerobic sulfatase maturase [Thermodesulfobacteriota bacterium]
MGKSLKPLDSILIKPAGPDCNMACTYCFYYEKAGLFSETKVHRMSDDILDNLIKQMMSQSGSQTSFGWQGGEPTLMGLPFFEKVVDKQLRYGRGQTVGNGLQTNGVLLERHWAKFLSRYKFLVGLSLDGPEHIHNRYRLMQNKKGSWSKVVDKAKLLLDHGVEVNTLIVVTDYSVQFPEEIYEFHKARGLNYMQFIPCVETDPKNPTRAAPFSVPPRKYGFFLCRLFDLWLDDFVDGVPTTFIRFFDSVLYSYAGMQPPECTLLRQCGVYVVVEHNGDVYSCDFFVEPKWKLGNIRDDYLIDLLNSPKQTGFGQIKSRIPKPCKKCKWLKYCRGGCIKDRIRDPGDNGVNHFCSSFKIFFEHADQHLKKLARNISGD